MSESKHDENIKKLKLAIKTWELEFTKSNQRKPTQEDIQAASPEIKDAYRSYWILKNKIVSEDLNKEDVWSPKLNKSYNEKPKIQTTDAIFQKFCSKIKKRSADIQSQISVTRLSLKENIIKECVKSETTDKYLCNQRFDEKKNNCDTSNSNNLKDEMQVIKPIKKIMKSDSICRKVKPVNFLSSSVDFKNRESNLRFDTKFDNEWLERCYNGKLTNLPNNEILLKNSCTSKRLIPLIVEEFRAKTIEGDKKSCTSPKTSSIQIPNSDLESEFLSQDNNVERSSVESTGCFSEVKNFDLQIPLKDEMLSNNEGVKSTKKRRLTKTQTINPKLSNHLERKMALGTMNENFVKVNIKKKKFCRGHRTVNVRKLKWQKWKELKKFGNGSAGKSSHNSCFKCGQPGHWARNCEELTRNSEKLATSLENFDDVPLPTLEEAADLTKESKNNILNLKPMEISKSAEISPSKVSISMPLKQDEHEFIEVGPPNRIIKPLYELAADGKLIETPSEVFDALKELGYSDFREGQKTAVMRILSGLSTLVVQPTGSGKSLCYQLPAYMYAKRFCCTAIVISPLVSLMEDQVTGLPPSLHAACLHSGMTDIQKKSALENLRNGKAHILLVSPEAVIASGMLRSDMPPVSFACIDEAHCLSQWSHNFRPSYLQLYKVLTECFNVKCILGLTATANRCTTVEIVSHLGLKSMDECVVGSTGIPQNLHLSVSRDKDKDRALIQLLTGDRFSNCSSIIIYCIRRVETERLAALIRTCLQDQIAEEQPVKKLKSNSRKINFKWTAEAYHAGLAPPRRRSIQKQFMTGKLRVIVATIAFGMGLDKRDVRAVIHFNMPKSFESYVQEIGRAGRDGLDSHCHLFLDNEGKDLQELQRFVYSNSTDRYVIRKLLKKVFVPCQCGTTPVVELNQSVHSVEALSDVHLQVSCPKHEIVFSMKDAVQELDMKEENISTLLCYLELHPKKWIELLSPTYGTCMIRCYGGPKQLQTLALKNSLIAAGFAIDSKKGKKLENLSSYEFPVLEVASVIKWDTTAVKRALKKLEWNGQKQKTGIIIEFSNLSFHLCAPGNLSADELDSILDFLCEKVSKSEKEEIFNLKSLHTIFSNFSQPHYWACCDEAPFDCSQGIKEAVNKYFKENKYAQDTRDTTHDTHNIDMHNVRCHIRDLIFTNHDQNFNGRAIARIFHGIESPCYPLEVWGKARKFWRTLLHVDFNLLLKLANEELKSIK